MNTYKELLEAARQVVYFAGPTASNLATLRAAVNEADEAERSRPPWDDEEDRCKQN